MFLLFTAAHAAPWPPEIDACVRSEQLRLYAPQSFERTEIETAEGWSVVWQIRDRRDDQSGYLLVYPSSCRVVVLIVDPQPSGAPVVQVITPYNTQSTDAEHRMLRRWAGVIAPMPAVCSQRSDSDGDGRFEHVQHYVYDDATGGLLAVLTDDDGDGRIDAESRYTVDVWGRPSGPKCASSYCSKTVTLQCPAAMTCTTGALGLIETMRSGTHTLFNDYSCWQPGPNGWSYIRPADLPH